MGARNGGARAHNVGRASIALHLQVVCVLFVRVETRSKTRATTRSQPARESQARARIYQLVAVKLSTTLARSSLQAQIDRAKAPGGGAGGSGHRVAHIATRSAAGGRILGHSSSWTRERE